MSSIVIKKNMFMKHRYGLFKSIVYRMMQLKSFTTLSVCILNNQKNTHNIEHKLIISILMFEYLSRTKDIWWQLDVSTIIKNKMFDFEYEDTELKQQFLIGFGYICTYTKRDGNMCCKRLEGEQTLCKIHSACKDRLKSRVSENLLSIHTDIHSIIFKYLF